MAGMGEAFCLLSHRLRLLRLAEQTISALWPSRSRDYHFSATLHRRYQTAKFLAPPRAYNIDY